MVRFPRVGIAFVLLGCQAREDAALGMQAILGGVDSTADDAVVFITSGESSCSGSLVAPNLVLTARHCFLSTETVGEACNIDGTSSVDTDVPLRQVEPGRIEIFLGQVPSAEPVAKALEIVARDSPTICRNDIALVVLDTLLVDAGVLPLRLMRPTQMNELVTIVGYGVSNEGRKMAIEPPRRRRREHVPVLDVGANRFNNRAGYTAPGTLLLGPGMCDGDSGGPAISEQSGAVVGVASIMSLEACSSESRNAYAQVAEYYELVLDAFARAHAEPWLESEAAPMASSKPNEGGCSLVGSTRMDRSRAGGLAFIGLLAGWSLSRRRNHGQNRPDTWMWPGERSTANRDRAVGRATKV